MAINCPACNKSNQTETVCQRCGCELSRLHLIKESASVLLSTAGVSLSRCDWPDALTRAEKSWRLVHSFESARVAFFAAAAVGDTQRALRWLERERSVAAESSS